MRRFTIILYKSKIYSSVLYYINIYMCVCVYRYMNFLAVVGKFEVIRSIVDGISAGFSYFLLCNLRCVRQHTWAGGTRG